LCSGVFMYSRKARRHYLEVGSCMTSTLLFLTFAKNRRYMDVPLLLSWLSARQYSPEGGLSGRTNKLVDGCYSHWVGGCWPLLQSALNGVQAASASVSPSVASLYSREGLARYILGCCQGPNGGLRDKPGKYVPIQTFTPT
jgi:prenyltransferase beta subunit